MRFAAFDTETELFSPANMVPRLVCLSLHRDGETALYGIDKAVEVLEALIDEALASPDEDPLIIATQNGPYDFAVMVRESGSMRLFKKIRQLYDRMRVWDCKLSEQLMDTADGCLNRMPDGRRPPKGAGWYGLKRMTKKYLGIELTKDGGPRENYGWLRGVPLSEWPPEYTDYALLDARATGGVAECQWARALKDPRGPLTNLAEQCKAYWALHLISAWGFATDPAAAGEYEVELTALMETQRVALAQIYMDVEVKKTRTSKGQKIVETFVQTLPLIEQRKLTKEERDAGETGEKWKTNTKVLQALVTVAYEAQGLAVPRTDPSAKFPDGQVATDAETIEACEDIRLKPWKDYKHSEKMLSNYIPVLKSGIVHARYDLAGTGRSTSYDPNIQNLPRKGKVRECYVARPGFELCSVDYGSQELVTFAQVMLWSIGPNALANALNQDLDPHLLFACEQMLHIDYEEGKRRRKAGDTLVKDKRQKAKGPNFGFPGGMGAPRFVEHMRAQDPPEFYTLEEAEEVRSQWFAQWPEARAYFRWVDSVSQEGWIRQFISRRVRGGMGFSDTANGFFQGLAADMSKCATYEVVMRCYTGERSHGWVDDHKPSALEGSRVVAFVHDELIAEVPKHRAHEAAHELADVMLQAARRYAPDVKSKAEPALMSKWYKGAEPVYQNGVLVPWVPEEKAA